MSELEKLRAIEAAMTPGPWDTYRELLDVAEALRRFDAQWSYGTRRLAPYLGEALDALDAKLRDMETRPIVGPGIALIAAERARQVAAKGWTADHDDQHDAGELAVRAAELAIEATDEEVTSNCHEYDAWGLIERHGKDRVRSLVIAGALIAAELDRELRAKLRGMEAP